MVRDLQRHSLLAVDTESNSLYVYREQVCLLQFSTGETDYLVDALSSMDLSILGPVFADEGIEKVFHAAEYDVICLKRDFGFEFANIFDTMHAARILGQEKCRAWIHPGIRVSNLFAKKIPAGQLGKAAAHARDAQLCPPGFTFFLIPLRESIKIGTRLKRTSDPGRRRFQTLDCGTSVQRGK